MYGGYGNYGCGVPTCAPTTTGHSGFGFAFILVLFILLVIIGCCGIGQGRGY